MEHWHNSGGYTNITDWITWLGYQHVFNCCTGTGQKQWECSDPTAISPTSGYQ